jgi:hypothetical protein
MKNCRACRETLRTHGRGHVAAAGFVKAGKIGEVLLVQKDGMNSISTAISEEAPRCR